MHTESLVTDYWGQRKEIEKRYVTLLGAFEYMNDPKKKAEVY
jgi:hypothetical protein